VFADLNGSFAYYSVNFLFTGYAEIVVQNQNVLMAV
jgi:hypothetical protein